MMIMAVLIVFCAGSTYTIPTDEIDTQKIFYGTGTSFQNPAEIDYEVVLRETPEFKEVEEKKIEPGTGKYWILLSQASDRVVKCITEVSQEQSYDLISLQGYLGSLKKPIPAQNATQSIVDKIKNRKN